MNKLKLFLYYIFLIFLLLSCKTNRCQVELFQLKSKHPIILYLNTEYQEIVRVKFPIKIKVKNNSSSKKYFSSIDYKYSPYSKGIEVPLYIEENKDLIRIKQSKKKEINSFESLEYLIYTRHRVDTSRAIQKHFNIYVDEMISKNLDTLTIGTIKEFKKKDIDILSILTNRDSISIDMWQDKNIVIPIQW